ncbi:MAG: hypothetical protein H0U74_06720 [Bradymonadaceae bacterium]|nr:hypothetical protein [Lujinxingiaceae bacterium]
MKHLLATVFLSALSLCTSVAFAQSQEQPQEQPDAQPERSTRRFAIDFTAGIHGRHPGGVEDFGGQVKGSLPFWYSAIAGPFQADLQAHAMLGLGQSPTVYPALALTAGGHLYILSWLSLEVRMGPLASLQISGNGIVPVLGFSGGGGYVFHPWPDHRRRLRLGIQMDRGFPTVADPRNDDCPLCYGYMGIGFGYETPY